MKETLTPDEIIVMQMALQDNIENMEEASKNPTFPFTPEARKSIKDMLTHMKSAKAKLAKLSGNNVEMEAFVEGDEKEFLTKES